MSDDTCDHDAYEVTAACVDCGAEVVPDDPYEDHLRELAGILDVEIPEGLHPQTVWEHLIDHIREMARHLEQPEPRTWSLPPGGERREDWGVRYPNGEVIEAPDEDDARDMLTPALTLVRRDRIVWADGADYRGPWTVADT